MRGSWRRRGKKKRIRARRLRAEGLEPRLMLSHDGDELGIWDIPTDLQELLDEEMAAPGDVNVSPFPQTPYTTLTNGMPILNSLPSAPAAIYIDFDGGVYHGSFTAQPYDVDGDSTKFNVEEQETIAEAWRQMSAYFAMFNVNVTTVQPSKPVAWLLVGNNISGGQSYVNVFPNSRPESRNASSHARTRVSGLAHEIGHNYGNQHTADYDNLGVKTAEYHDAFDPLHGPIMGLDYSGVIHKWTTWHSRNGANVLQDDMAVIAADLDNFGGDGYRPDDFGGTIATAAPLTTIGTTQAKVGIIERLTDVDMFAFASVGGTYSVLVGRDNPSGVDVKVSILDATGAVLALEDGDPRTVPSTMVNDSHITLALPAGTFYVKVESHGNYGDQGQYIVRVDPLADGWRAEDIGLNGVPGFANYDAATGVYTVAGSGADIAGSSDGAQFLHQTLTGNGSITVRVTGLDNTSSGAKAGIMIRESLAENSRHVALVITPTSGIQWSARSTPGGGTSSTTVSGSFAPTWLRITRSGNSFTAWRSPDGTSWTQVGSQRTVSMASVVSIGPVVSAKNNSRLSTATFTDVELTGSINAQPTLNNLPPPADLVATSITHNTVALAWANPSLLGDTNGDGVVDAVDYANVRDNFGGSGPGDVNFDGTVDIADFRIVKDNVGNTSVATLPQSYVVERSSDGVQFVEVGSTPGNVTTFTSTGLSDFQRYTYRVRGVNSSGVSGPSESVVATTKAGAVSSLNIISFSSSQLILDWRDASGEANYRIERSPNGVDGWTTRGLVGKNVPMFTDSALAANTRYFYRVVTLEAGNLVAASSAIASAYTRLVTVSGLAFTVQAANQLAMQWNAVAGATSYFVERSTNSTDFSTIASNILATNYADNSVAPATQYYYRVTAMNANTRSAASSSISTTTPSSAGGGAGFEQVAGADPTPEGDHDHDHGHEADAENDLGGGTSLTVSAGDSATFCETVHWTALGGRGPASKWASLDEALSSRWLATRELTDRAVDRAFSDHVSEARPAPRLSDKLLQTIARHRRALPPRPIETIISRRPI